MRVWSLEHEKLIENATQEVIMHGIESVHELAEAKAIELLIEKGLLPAEDASTEDHIGEADKVPEVGLTVEIPLNEGPKTFAELDAEIPETMHVFGGLEDQEIPEDFEIPEVQELDMNEIAEIAYNSVAFYKNMMWPAKEKTPLYEALSEEDKEHLKGEIDFHLQQANNPNDTDLARMKYAQDAMQRILEGKAYDAADPIMIPWEFLPNSYKRPYILFRLIAVDLLRSVWIGR